MGILKCANSLMHRYTTAIDGCMAMDNMNASSGHRLP